jgi:formate/nitrite transporter FocA (FNT family)
MPQTTTQVELSDEEIQEAEKRAMPRAAVVFETFRRGGEGELNRTISALTFSAVSAGLSMGFSLFTIAILGRQQLFTENTLTPVLVLLHRFDGPTLWSVVRLWAIVIAGNLVGALAFATLLAHVPVFGAELQRSFGIVAVHATNADALSNFVRAIYLTSGVKPRPSGRGYKPPTGTALGSFKIRSKRWYT